MFATMLLNIFPTPAPKSARSTITAIPTNRISSAYSTSPWPFEEEKNMNALNRPDKSDDMASIGHPFGDAIALRSQSAYGR